jgi:hypothetical protein
MKTRSCFSCSDNNESNPAPQNEDEDFENLENESIYSKRHRSRKPRGLPRKHGHSSEENDFKASNPAIPESSTSPDSNARRQEFLSKAVSIIKSK